MLLPFKFKKRSKHNSIKCEVDGIKFDSKKEARRYKELLILQLAGNIKDLKLQQSFSLLVNQIEVCRYVADFVYFDNEKGKQVVEDVKGFKTRMYILKKKLMKAVYGIEILEV